MEWLGKIFIRVRNIFLFKFKKEKAMAKIVLEDSNGKPIEFELSELIYIGYDQEKDCIVLCLANKPPMYLPLTKGNVDLLQFISPYFKQKAINDPRMAIENIGNKPRIKI